MLKKALACTVLSSRYICLCCGRAAVSDELFLRRPAVAPSRRPQANSVSSHLCPCRSGLRQPISEPSPGPHFVLHDPYRGLELPSPNRRDPWPPQIATIAAPGRPGSVLNRPAPGPVTATVAATCSSVYIHRTRYTRCYLFIYLISTY